MPRHAESRRGVDVETVYISLVATYHPDGTMFVTSPSHTYIGAEVRMDDWGRVLDLVKASIQANVGQVKSIEYVPAREETNIPPAHVIAATVALERAGLR